MLSFTSGYNFNIHVWFHYSIVFGAIELFNKRKTNNLRELHIGHDQSLKSIDRYFSDNIVNFKKVRPI